MTKDMSCIDIEIA